MSERNWQEDLDWVTNTNHTPYTETETIAIHWLQEIKSLREQLAHANCEWQREKSMRYSAVAREQKLKMLIEDLINSDVDEIWKASAARYLQKVYGDAA